jgi:hypothetical protein
MQTVKRIGISLAIILVLLTTFSFLLPKNIHVERTAIIKAPADSVFVQINTLKNWNSWSPWNKLDPDMKIVYNEIPAGTGAAYEWKSKKRNVGNGKLCIVASAANDSICTNMNFMEHGVAKGIYKFKQVEGGTQLTWIMETDMGMNPIMRYMGLMMDKMVGKDFEKGLNNLKAVCEKTN